MGLSFPLIPIHCSSTFCPPCNRIAQHQNNAPSCLEQEVLSASPTANKPGPPLGEGNDGHEGPARVTGHSRPSCAHPLPLLCSRKVDWVPSVRAVVLGGHPWGCFTTEKVDLLARENSIKKQKKNIQILEFTR